MVDRPGALRRELYGSQFSGTGHFRSPHRGTPSQRVRFPGWNAASYANEISVKRTTYRADELR